MESEAMNELTPNLEPAESAAHSTDEGARPNSEDASQRQSRRRQPGQVLDLQQCLAGISQLPGMLALGLLKPAAANSMRGALKDLLDHHREDRQPASGTVATDDMIAAIRKDPTLLNWLEKMLTDEQFDLVMKAVQEEQRGEA
jgi:hypothetical protein